MLRDFHQISYDIDLGYLVDAAHPDTFDFLVGQESVSQFPTDSTQHFTTVINLSAPVIKSKKTPGKSCSFMAKEAKKVRYIDLSQIRCTNTLIRCHQNAFRYFGGYPEEILYDNMKQVVIKHLLKQEDSTLNRQFEDFAGFYGVKPIPCRPYLGQTEGKAERTVQFVRDNFMVGIK